MTKVKIIAIDNVVMVDDVTLKIDTTELIDKGVWSVSFDGTTGEIEYTDDTKENQRINHVADYQRYIDLHGQELAKQTEEQAEIEQQMAAEMAPEKAKLDGFDYKGKLVSYTEKDRQRVAEASQTFEKKKPSGEPYVEDGQALKVTFANETVLWITREEFENEFFQAFFAHASPEFM